MSSDDSDETYPSFLGTGWSFPPRFLMGSEGEGAMPRLGQVAMTADQADIEASLRILFGTGLGERFLKPKYGLDMHELLFDPMSTTMKTFLEDRIRTAILIDEPRIRLVSLTLDTSRQYEGRIQIIMEYEIRTTNSRYNLVYPFYTSDSSEVRSSIGSTGG
jgi:hypothetical protein